VYVRNNKLVLDTKGGVTTWFHQKLSGNLRIEYDREVIVAGGPNDRLSDFNQFWMATDPRNSHLFTRSGVLESYDSLSLYYIGMGGNTNKTTRFRKYQGNGQKPLLQEYTDSAHLLEANKVYHIIIIVKNNETSYWVNGQCYFLYSDTAILKEGYFGFRSTKSRQEISNVKIVQLN
jgi:rhamnogalacturonan endolyase